MPIEKEIIPTGSPEKEWTLMFFFASDNILANQIVFQLKAIKDAGFQENTDVVVYVDPDERGVPTRIYDVNRKRKSQPPHTKIGDGADPFVRNMAEDNVDPKDIEGAPGSSSAIIQQALKKPDTIDVQKALLNFLGFCREKHRAKRYMLFLVGHGMIVANDAFLPDDNPISAITLKELGDILQKFTADLTADEKFELLALHSCSMSSIEVAYELKGTANYMIATEGPSYVGSWPYRQLLKKIFNNVEKAKRKARHIDIPALLHDLYFLTLFNATDFLLTGYSHDLTLCSLDAKKYDDLTASIQELVGKLIAGLQESSPKNGAAATDRGKRIKELVLLSHWEAQSYWEENYTDLFDFCRCLRERCNPRGALKDLRDVCFSIMEKLKPIKSKPGDKRFHEEWEKALVIRSENFGSKYQYSHGFAIYFPWSKPIEFIDTGNQGAKKGILENYKVYKFKTELGGNSWLDFLLCYFEETRRRSRIEEDGKVVDLSDAAFKAARASFDPFGVLAGNLSSMLGTETPFMGTETPFMAVACSCPSIKNYPDEKEPKEIAGKTVDNTQAFVLTEGALQAFK